MPESEHDPTTDDLSGLQPAELAAVIADIDVRLNELHTDARGEVVDLNADDQARWDRLMAVRGHAEARQRQHEALAAAYNRARPGAFQRAYGNLTGSEAFTRDAPEVLRMGGDELRSSALRLLEHRGRDLPPAAQDRVAETVSARLGPANPNLDGEYVARRLLITESEEYRSAFQQVMTEDHPLLTEGEIRALRSFRELESRAMGEVTPSAGGYGVPSLIDPTILLQSGAAVAPILGAARVVPVTSNNWKGVSSAPPTFIFQTESAVVADSSPSLTQPAITVHMARAMLPYSYEVESDYPNFANEMYTLLEQGWTDLVATKTCTGSGTGEPWGIITRLDATASSEVLVTTAGTVDAAMVFKVWNALPERFRYRSNWLMSVSQESNIRSFGAGPNPSAYFTIDLTQDGITRLNGRPTMVTDYSPAYVSGSSGHINHMVVGDFSQYVIAMRQGLSIERVPNLFQQATAGTGVGMPTAQRGFFAWGRWGADAAVPGAFRLLNQT
jgi:HK97 family phage major capsid protein